MLPLEIIILIANICLSPSTNQVDVDTSQKCNQYMLECVPRTVRQQMLKNGTIAFNQCYIEFEVSR